jgi:hypothetical protein
MGAVWPAQILADCQPGGWRQRDGAAQAGASILAAPVPDYWCLVFHLAQPDILAAFDFSAAVGCRPALLLAAFLRVFARQPQAAG